MSENGSRSVDRNCWQDLIDLYNTEDALYRKRFWDRDVVFLPDDQLGEMVNRVLDPAGEFMRDDPGNLQQVHEYIFQRPSDRPARLLIQAEAGFGKTALCQTIVRDWTGGGQLFDSALLVYCRLRDLARHRGPLLEGILRFLRDHYKGSTISMTHDLAILGSRVVLLLDGYDELTEELQVELLELLRGHADSRIRQASVVLTSRPNEEKPYLILFDKHFTLRGLSRSATEVAVEKFFSHKDNVSFFLSKYEELFAQYKSPPLLIAVVCYLQRHFIKVKLWSMEDALFQCVLEICKRSASRETVSCTRLQAALLSLGKHFFKDLQERRFVYSSKELEDILPAGLEYSLLKRLFTKALSRTGERDVFEVIHSSLMEVLAMLYASELWYSLPRDEHLSNILVQHFTGLRRLQVFAYRTSSGKPHFKVIADHPSLGCAVWDWEGGSCVFSSYLTDSHVSRHMGKPVLNVNFLIFLTKQDNVSNVLKVIGTMFAEENFLSFLSELFTMSAGESLRIHFVVDREHSLCPAVSWLSEDRPEGMSESGPLIDLRNACSEISLTFSELACNHERIVRAISKLVEPRFRGERETTSAVELLNALKKYDKTSTGFRCTLASAFMSGVYYVVDTKTRFLVEDLRPWYQRFLQPSFYWSMTDVFVVTYNRLG